MNRFSLLIVLGATLASGCAAVQGATKAGMKPILINGIDGFLTEGDPAVAEGAIVANMKLIEGVVATYPDDVELLNMAAMARANYAFGFLQDQLEALKLAHPDDSLAALRLLDRVLSSYKVGRGFAERSLLENSGYRDVLNGRPLEDVPIADLKRALDELDEDEAEAVFWLAFNWGGTMQANLDPAEATQLPKVELLTLKVLEMDEHVFFDVGPHMLAGVFFGFRSPALGGNPEVALAHFAKAHEMGQVLLPLVLKAQFVFAQTERQEDFVATLNEVIEATPRQDRLLLDKLAQLKACRLLANLDAYFLDDAQPVSDRCMRLPHRYRLRAEPLEPAEPEEPAEPAETPNSTPAAS